MKRLKNCSKQNEVKGLEGNLKNRINKWAKTQADVFLVKIHGSPMQRKGLPDFIGNIGTVAVYIELKTNTNMSPLQQSNYRKIKRTGAQFVEVRTFDAFLDFITGIRNLKKALEL